MAQPIVLVVEDEPAVRTLLSLVLETRDYRVITAEDGAEALALVQTDQPDAIVLDMMLPNVDGWAVLETLGRDAQADRIPIIAMSAGASRADASLNGVTAFLSKPFDVQGLLAVLDEALQPACRIGGSPLKLSVGGTSNAGLV